MSSRFVFIRELLDKRPARMRSSDTDCFVADLSVLRAGLGSFMVNIYLPKTRVTLDILSVVHSSLFCMLTIACARRKICLTLPIRGGGSTAALLPFDPLAEPEPSGKNGYAARTRQGR